MLFDKGRYRCWYIARLKGETETSTVDQGRAMSVSGSALAYAESTDGEKWVKPSLKILSYQGSLENNLVCPFNNGGAIFRDDHGPPEERYKGFNFDKLPDDKDATAKGPQAKYGLYGVSSPDGYHWTKNPKPLIRYFADTTNIAAWDPLLEKYVGYFRHHLGGRSISRAETTDFWNWPEPQPLLYAGPDGFARRRLLHQLLHDLSRRAIAPLDLPRHLPSRQRLGRHPPRRQSRWPLIPMGVACNQSSSWAHPASGTADRSTPNRNSSICPMADWHCRTAVTTRRTTKSGFRISTATTTSNRRRRLGNLEGCQTGRHRGRRNGPIRDAIDNV